MPCKSVHLSMSGIPPKYLSGRVAEARSQSSTVLCSYWRKPLTLTLSLREREHNVGGLIRQLSSERVRITSRGVDVVERHVSRFGSDRANAVMIERLRAIAEERME